MNKCALLITPTLESFLSNWIYKTKKDPADMYRIYFDLNNPFRKNDIPFLETLYKVNEYIIDESVVFGSGVPSSQNNKYILMSIMAQTRYETNIILLNAAKDSDSILTNQKFLDSIKHTIQLSTKTSNIIIDNILKDIELGVWCELFVEKNPNNKTDLITKTTDCKNYFKPRNIPIFTFVNTTYKELCTVDMVGCLECDKCFRWVCALNMGGLFLPFFNKRIININLNKERTSQYIANLYPKKVESVRRLYRFLDWINFKNIRF